MRKAKRAAVKLEQTVQRLAAIKVCGAPDERAFARRRLANGLSGRYQHGQRVDPKLVQTMHILRGNGYATA